MLLPLITPTGSNFLKDFPAQHSVNADLMDAYANSCLTSDSLKSYTPQFTASITNPTLGTGGVARLVGYYYEIFDQIFTWGELRFGTSGMNAGSGVYIISLPFPNASSLDYSRRPAVGTGILWDASNGANRQPVTVHAASSTTIRFTVRNDSGLAGREVSETPSGFTWDISDGLAWNAHYQRLP